MKKKLLSLVLSLAMCLGLLPVNALAVETSPPDWYFLFAIFKNVDADYSDVNGDSGHTVNTMTQDEIDMLRINARELEEFLSQVGVIRPHVDVVEIDTPITELEYSNVGSDLGPEQAASLLADAKVDLNQYDHVFCIASLNVDMSAYTGATGVPFENGTGQSFINTVNLKYWTYTVTHRNPVKLFNHEFLHFMEQMSSRWGSDFRLHLIGDKFYANDASTAAQTDIMLNRVKGDAESGTGIAPVVWQYPPHILRTSNGWTIPSGMIKIRDWDFGYSTVFAAVTIPTSVTSIGYAAFYKTGIKDIYYEGTEAQWKAIEIGEYNDDLTKATIHYNSTIETPATSIPSTPTTPTQPVKFTDVPVSAYYYAPMQWAVQNGITAGTSATTFSPGTFCTTAQILTFLWRSQGSPKPTGANLFSDVKDSDYYYDAAVWAHERGLISYDILQGNRPCTRSDVVTYLWKLAGSPEAKAANFTDVSAKESYAEAVNWAVEQGITAGTSDTTFSPLKACTRGQIVTFLYRAFAKQ